jgi:hypothetical protein
LCVEKFGVCGIGNDILDKRTTSKILVAGAEGKIFV